MAAGPTVPLPETPTGCVDEEGAMFIFNRPVTAVAAGFAVAFLMVGLDRLCQPSEAAFDSPVANTTLPLVSPPSHAVSSAPVRDLSLSCRLPPAL